MAKPTLKEQIEILTTRLAEAEETLRAIHAGEVDAVVVKGPKRLQVYTLEGADKPHRLLVEAMNEGALELNPEGLVLYCNSRLAEMVKRPLEHIIGSPWQRLFGVREQPIFQALLTQARESKDGRSKGESALRTSEETPVPVQVSLSVTEFDGVPALAILLTDISARKKAEEALRQAKAELEARVKERTAELARAKAGLEHYAKQLEDRVAERTAKLNDLVGELEQFSYTITHDMRAPLRAMQGFGNMLLEDCGERLTPAGQDLLRRIITSANRMDSLIADALNYSKAVRQELVLQPIPVGPLLHEIIESYPHLQPPQALIHIDPNLPVVLANQAGLTQCFSNILGNAVKFVAPGTTPKVRVRAEERGEYVRLWFEDNGIGIAQEHHQRIFRMFQRLSKDYEGTGIGLALVRRIVGQMKGEIGVESGLGQGSRFWLDLQRSY